jgi:hypothetical protein
VHKEDAARMSVDREEKALCPLFLKRAEHRFGDTLTGMIAQFFEPVDAVFAWSAILALLWVRFDAVLRFYLGLF